jgi:hypothetical protein
MIILDHETVSMRDTWSCPNPLQPDLMTPAERLAEIGEILAAGLIRLLARKSSGLVADRGDSFLDFTADQRSHVSPTRRRGTR